VSALDWLRLVGPLALGALAALAVERSSARRHLEPPGLRPDGVPGWRARRRIASLGLALALYLVAFQPLGLIGLEVEIDPAQLRSWQLFLGHAILLAAVALWCAAGFAGVPGLPARRQPGVWVQQLGLRAPRAAIEVGIGLAVGALAWAVVLAAMLLLAFVLTGLGASRLVPREAPGMIAALGALPIWLRVAVSVSAGLAEETFFRGFLQPRAGVAVSTVLFVMAHIGYQQPLMLVGVTLLSLCFAALSVWRQNVWAAVTAHTTFDAIQLLWVVPAALDALAAGR
jgi:membrane protease YdiL (CAAX protease family)